MDMKDLRELHVKHTYKAAAHDLETRSRDLLEEERQSGRGSRAHLISRVLSVFTLTDCTPARKNTIASMVRLFEEECSTTAARMRESLSCTGVVFD